MRKGEAFEKAGNLEAARAEYVIAISNGYPGAAEKAELMRNKLVSRYSSAARVAFAKQDLDNCIANWDRVLILESGNSTAKFERERAVRIKTEVPNSIVK